MNACNRYAFLEGVPIEVICRLTESCFSEVLAGAHNLGALPSHPNIAPLLGWTVEPFFSFISPWYKRGSLHRHLKDLSSIQRLRAVRESDLSLTLPEFHMR